MVTVFPTANSRTPDLYNLIRIHGEITSLETLILNSRYNGERLLTVNSTTFTNTTLNTPVEFDNTILGTANYATNTEVAVTPGTTLQYNSNQLTFQIIVDGTVEFNDTDVTTVISVNGNLQLGLAPTAVAVTTLMTLADVATAINTVQSTTGIHAEATLNTGTGNYFLKLTKDNTVETSTLIIDGTSTASVLTDLGFTAASYVVDVVDVASQIGADGSVNGAGPYNIQLDNSSGVYIIGGTALVELGLTKSINLTTNVVSITSHGFTTGDQVSLTSPGNLPVPLNAFPTSYYFVIVVDANSFKLATTRLNALEGTAIDLTSDGNNYFTVKATTDAEVYYQVWKGYTENDVFKQRMDEVIAYFEDKNYIIYRQTNATTNLTLQWVIQW